MTQVMLISGVIAYTDLTPEEVRYYLQKGTKAGTFEGYLDEAKAQKILIAATAVQYVKM